MNEFRAGDKVICKKASGSGWLVEGHEYTVSGANQVYLSLESFPLRKYSLDRFELAPPTLIPRKHQKEIIAWANGATIQYWWSNAGRWVDKDNPLWSNDIRYRVKPDADNTAEVEAEITELEAMITELKKDL